MAFFGASGPGSLTGSTPGGADPETQKILAQIQKAYPQLGAPQMPGGAPQSPTTLGQAGYGFQGVPLFFGQGSAGSNPFGNVNSLFESARGSQADSITGAMSSGQTGSQFTGPQFPTGPVGGPPAGGGGAGGGAGGGIQSFAAQPGFVQDPGMTTMGGGSAPQTLDLGAAVNAGTGLYNMFTGRSQTPSMPSGSADTGGVSLPDLQGVSGPLPPGAPSPGPTGQQMPTDQGAYNEVGLQAGQTQAAQPGGLFGTGVTGNQALGGLNTVGGLYNLQQGIQGGNPLQALGGAAGAAGGATAAFPQTSAALLGSSAPYVGAGLGGIGGGLGIYGGIQSLRQGDVLGGATQLGTGAAGLYGAGAGLTNAITGTNTLPSLSQLGSQALSGVGNALGVGAGAGVTAGTAAAATAAEEAALTGSAIGAGAGAAEGAGAGYAGGAAAGLVALAPSLAGLFNLGGTGGAGIGGMWGAENQGISRDITASNIAAANAADISQPQMAQALQAYQQATAGGMPTNPAILQQLAQQLQGGELSYYQTQPYMNYAGANGLLGGSVGASSNFTGANNPAAMQPYAQGFGNLQSIIQALQGQGQQFAGLSPQWQGIFGSNNPAYLGGPAVYAPGANRETLQQYGSALAGGDISGTSA